MIVISYADYSAADLVDYEPRVVHVDLDNRIITVDADPSQLLTP